MCNKITNTISQTELNYSERKANVKDSFKFIAEHKNTIKDKSILIVDDIFTTGATTSELSNVLLQAGAKSCHVLTLAHVSVNKSKSNN